MSLYYEKVLEARETFELYESVAEEGLDWAARDSVNLSGLVQEARCHALTFCYG